VRFVRLDIAREAARRRPDGAGIESFEPHRMRHQARDAAIPVDKWIDTNQRTATPSGRSSNERKTVMST
jgi:hypothetical protein